MGAINRARSTDDVAADAETRLHVLRVADDNCVVDTMPMRLVDDDIVPYLDR
jgi:hypothetical protein